MALFNATKKGKCYLFFLDQNHYMVFSYSKVLPNPWGKTVSATIIIYPSLVQLLCGRHENSKYDISSQYIEAVH